MPVEVSGSSVVPVNRLVCDQVVSPSFNGGGISSEMEGERSGEKRVWEYRDGRERLAGWRRLYQALQRWRVERSK